MANTYICLDCGKIHGGSCPACGSGRQRVAGDIHLGALFVDAYVEVQTTGKQPRLIVKKASGQVDIPLTEADLLERPPAGGGDLLTTEQVAERLEMPKRTVQAWVARGVLPSVDTPVKSGTGTVSLIPAEALETFERPKVGYPKGRPRKAEEASEDDPKK